MAAALSTPTVPVFGMSRRLASARPAASSMSKSASGSSCARRIAARSPQRQVVERWRVRDDNRHFENDMAVSESLTTSCSVTGSSTPCAFRNPSIS